MCKCFVLRSVATLSTDQALAIRGRFGDAMAIVTAQELLASDGYAMLNARDVLANCKDAEEVFDALNMSDDHYMTVGDVIVWNNGKRELCLGQGWATI